MTEPTATASPQQAVASRPRERIFLPQRFSDRVRSALWTAVRQLLFRPTPASCNIFRIVLLRLFGADVEYSAFIHPTVRVDFPWNLSVGRYVVIEHRVILNCMGMVRIGERTRVSQYAHFCAGTHDYRDSAMTILRKPIHVGRDVWIAADTFVGPGVTIGDGALLAARSSAFNDLPAGTICVGEPAKPRKQRFADRPSAHEAAASASTRA